PVFWVQMELRMGARLGVMSSVSPLASAPQGDLLLLLDSSASVSHYEFSRVREFVGQLVALLPLGPGALHASLVHVGSRPHTEFPFNQHNSSQAVQDAIRAAAQRMGDTNTGLALAYAREQLFAEAMGARPGVPKVLVWVTDGASSDPVGPPMQELKDHGVTVFIVSTGRGNLLELSAAASAPAQKHLHFVDVDDLHIIAPELRGSILATEKCHHPRIFTKSLPLGYSPTLSRKVWVCGLGRGRGSSPKATHWTWAGLDPDSEYDVVLLPESNVHLLKPQHLRVRTLPDEAGPERIVISHARPHSLRVSWAPALGPVAALGYQVQLGPLSGGAAQRVDVPAGRNSTTLQGLAPGTAYLVTVTAAFRSGHERALSAKACTKGCVSRLRTGPAAGPRRVAAALSCGSHSRPGSWYRAALSGHVLRDWVMSAAPSRPACQGPGPVPLLHLQLSPAGRSRGFSVQVLGAHLGPGLWALPGAWDPSNLQPPRGAGQGVARSRDACARGWWQFCT
uniref:von Willebrand factor A domain-containing protein 1 n=1 Tax=Spermophilus dauricus TaxID=99837 RepID=A0A8C9P1W1_SPEDA